MQSFEHFPAQLRATFLSLRALGNGTLSLSLKPLPCAYDLHTSIKCQLD